MRVPRIRHDDVLVIPDPLAKHAVPSFFLQGEQRSRSVGTVQYSSFRKETPPASFTRARSSRFTRASDTRPLHSKTASSRVWCGACPSQTCTLSTTNLRDRLSSITLTSGCDTHDLTDDRFGSVCLNTQWTKIDSMVVLIYSTLAAIANLLSALATGVIVAKLQRHWELSVSCVRWLFYMFFLSYCIRATLRCGFFVWMILAGNDRQVNPEVEKELKTLRQLDMISIHSIPRSTLSHDVSLALLISAGDVALFAVGLWIFGLTYELGRIVIKSMDRGPRLEAQRIRVYKLVGAIVLTIFAAFEFAIVIYEGGYTKATHVFDLTILSLHVCGLVYMSATLTFIKCRGRKYEPMHGVFEPSPVYQRLKRTMIVYGLFASQYHVCAILLSVIGTRSDDLLPFMGISMVIFTSSGVALSIVTGCSQACVLQACSACIPEDLEAQYMQHKIGGATATQKCSTPPDGNPVFIYTDIESSSALWALAEDGVMEKATDIHDNIMRLTLSCHHGYEITTCGDSFQLAFPSIKDAVAYCVDVQLQLLTAPWPKQLQGIVPATKKQRSGHRLIFNGLRVRMGIHDCVDEEGALVCERHAVTGNMTYTGASEAIACEVSELGCGGQILVTERVAQWVRMHSDEFGLDLKVELLGHYHMGVLQHGKDVYQIIPSILVGRRKYWPIPTQQLGSATSLLSSTESSPPAVTALSAQQRSRSFPEIVVPTPPTPINTPTVHRAASSMRMSLDPVPESPTASSTKYVAINSTGSNPTSST